MIQQLLKHSIRKDILKGNKKINHKSFVGSLSFPQNMFYLMKYHKKKLIFSILVAIIIKTYELQKPIYRKIVTMRSPISIIQGYFIQSSKIQETILEQNLSGIDLDQKTIDFLTKLYYEFDKQLYFGVGRNYLFQVYRELGTIKTDEQKRKFWSATGFFKERNQKASGVGCVQFVQLFEEALAYMKKQDQSLQEKNFLWEFTNKFIEKRKEMKRWQFQFNKQRFSEFIKNQASDNPKKKDSIIEIMKENPEYQMSEVEDKIKKLGLKGLSLEDKFMYWEIKRTWMTLQIYNIHKQLSHPLTSESEKIKLSEAKNKQIDEVQKVESTLQRIKKQFKLTYKQDLLSEQKKQQ